MLKGARTPLYTTGGEHPRTKEPDLCGNTAHSNQPGRPYNSRVDPGWGTSISLLRSQTPVGASLGR